MEEYMKTLLEQIRCKSAKKMVEKEIREHILEQYEENLEAGMDKDCAMEAAVEDMGSPVETGIALDAIHRPQMSWGMISILAVLSFFSILIQVLIGRENSELGNPYILKHVFHVVLGFCLMLAVYRMDYTFLGKYPKHIAAVGGAFLFGAIFFGGQDQSMEVMHGFKWEVYLRCPLWLYCSCHFLFMEELYMLTMEWNTKVL